jgi:hypothetical protein
MASSTRIPTTSDSPNKLIKFKVSQIVKSDEGRNQRGRNRNHHNQGVSDTVQEKQ